MSWNDTAYFLDAQALLTKRIIVLCVYAARACSFNYKSDYSISWIFLWIHPWINLKVFSYIIFSVQYFQFYSLSPTNIYIPCGVVYQIKVIFWIQFFWKISQNPFKLIYIYISLWNIQSPMKIVKWLLLSLKWKKNNSSSIDLKFIIITDFSPPYRFMDGVCSALMLGRDEEVITWKSLRRVNASKILQQGLNCCSVLNTAAHHVLCFPVCFSHSRRISPLRNFLFAFEKDLAKIESSGP